MFYEFIKWIENLLNKNEKFIRTCMWIQYAEIMTRSFRHLQKILSFFFHNYVMMFRSIFGCFHKYFISKVISFLTNFQSKKEDQKNLKAFETYFISMFLAGRNFQNWAIIDHPSYTASGHYYKYKISNDLSVVTGQQLFYFVHSFWSRNK